MLFKEDTNSTIKVIEKFDKQELGIADNTDFSVTFDNGKIYTILPSYEILRLYDNVPRFAQAQTMMGNRLMYGNYIDGYDLKDANNNLTKLEYSAEVVTSDILIKEINTRRDTGIYNIDAAALLHPVVDSVVYIDLTGIPLLRGSFLELVLQFDSAGFTSDTPTASSTPNTVINFTFQLGRDYTSVYDLATGAGSTNFIATN